MILGTLDISPEGCGVVSRKSELSRQSRKLSSEALPEAHGVDFLEVCSPRVSVGQELSFSRWLFFRCICVWLSWFQNSA